MSQKNFAVPIANTRNVTVLAHVDHGKTSFVDSLLSANNIISSRMAGKIRYLDSREDEQERGITMESSAVSLQFQMLRRQKEGTPPLPPHHILNLIDTPGHVDFASEVSTASRLCDGALVLVDVVEGVCTQTIAVLRQAWLDNLKPLLVINKLDRLITELKLSPGEAYTHLQQLIEQVNAVMGSFFASERMEEDLRWRERREERLARKEAARNAEEDAGAASANGDEEDEDGYEEKEDEDLYFAPERGNVIFASAIDGWAFRLGKFAQLYAAKLGIQEMKLRRVLWGDYYLDPKSKKVLGRNKALATGRPLKPLFVQFVLDNIWRVYQTVLEEHNPDAVSKIVTALNLRVTPRDLRSKDTRTLLQVIFQQWLPLSTCTFQAVVDVIPSPSDAQPIRLPRMLHPTVHSSPNTGAVPPKTPLEDDLYHCKQGANAHIVAYVSKMFAVAKSDLPENRRREITAEEMRQRGREEREKRLAQMQAANNGEEGSAESRPTEVSLDSAAALVSSSTEAKTPDVVAAEERGDALIAFARIYSGTIKRDTDIQCVLPKYNASLPSTHPSNVKHLVTARIDRLYMMMGRDLVPVEEVPAGNIFAIGGLEGKVLRNATLCASSSAGSSDGEHAEGLVNLAGVVMQAAPIVRVALEPENPADLPKLVEGLRLLNQADPCVEVLVQETGEHVILTAGELHLERCLKDLRERFARCGISASEAIVPFRETAVRVPDMNPTKSSEGVRGRFVGSSVQSYIDVTIRSHPLPQDVVEFLQRQSASIQALASETAISAEQDAATGESTQDRAISADGALRVLSPPEFWSKLEGLLRQAGGEWRDVADDIWAFGGRRVGPNLLINKTGVKGRSLKAKSEAIAKAQAEGRTETEVAELVQDLASTNLQSTSDAAADKLATEFDDDIETGFQLACHQGPLCAEPVVGMAYFVEKVAININEENEDAFRSRSGQVTGSLITGVREACRNGLLDWSPRMMLAMYSCDIQASTEVLGKVYGVVARRRGRIVSEEMKEGTSFFTIRALLPVVESFGFADEIRKRTSGAASPQLIFNGFEMLDEDPYWVPTTQEELEDLGEKSDRANIARGYMDGVRKRKGMFVQEKLVENAEKQKTLKR